MRGRDLHVGPAARAPAERARRSASAIAAPLADILAAVHATLEETPPELAADITQGGHPARRRRRAAARARPSGWRPRPGCRCGSPTRRSTCVAARRRAVARGARRAGADVEPALGRSGRRAAGRGVEHDHEPVPGLVVGVERVEHGQREVVAQREEALERPDGPVPVLGRAEAAGVAGDELGQRRQRRGRGRTCGRGAGSRGRAGGARRGATPRGRGSGRGSARARATRGRSRTRRRGTAARRPARRRPRAWARPHARSSSALKTVSGVPKRSALIVSRWKSLCAAPPISSPRRPSSQRCARTESCTWRRLLRTRRGWRSAKRSGWPRTSGMRRRAYRRPAGILRPSRRPAASTSASRAWSSSSPVSSSVLRPERIIGQPP